MKTKKFWILTAIFICCISSLSIVVYGISPTEKQQIKDFGVSTLQGLEGVHIRFMVADIGGLKHTERPSNYMYPEDWEDEFYTEVELALRRNGVKIFSGKRTTGEASAGLTVLVVVNSTKIETEYFYGFTVSVTVDDTVVTIRKPHILTSANIWSCGAVKRQTAILSGRKHLKQGMKEEILMQITVFCNDYLAANPKPRDEQKQ